MPIDFHSRCDNKGPTVSLFKIEGGDCVGGYTEAQWQSTENEEYFKDRAATLFNLTQERKFKNKGTSKQIRCLKSCGPDFRVGGFSELGLTDDLFDGKETCYSWVNEPGYGIPIKGGMNMLTN